MLCTCVCQHCVYACSFYSLRISQNVANTLYFLSQVSLECTLGARQWHKYIYIYRQITWVVNLLNIPYQLLYPEFTACGPHDHLDPMIHWSFHDHLNHTIHHTHILAFSWSLIITTHRYLNNYTWEINCKSFLHKCVFVHVWMYAYIIYYILYIIYICSSEGLQPMQ